MKLFQQSVAVRLGVVVVIAIAVQFLTRTSWLAIVLLVSYFVAKEIAALVLRFAPAAALLAAAPRLRVAAFVCDNLAFLAALFGLFVLQKGSLADPAAIWRFAAFEVAEIVFVAAWAMVAAAAMRRAAGVVKI